MQLEVLPNSEVVAREAARRIAAAARDAVAAHGLFTLAVSGGRTPWVMLRDLAEESVPWEHLQVFQVDERIAPAGDPDRNLTHLHESLLERAPIDPAQIFAMPVESADPAAVANEYAATLAAIAGKPPVLDLIHLGLGPDGHTASLIPGDAVLQVDDSDVATTGVYQNRRRMTLTYPLINRARSILWLVTGKEKQEMLRRLLAADPTIPAGRVRQEHALILADADAAGELAAGTVSA
jgi:6-phosphogluconolactonase